MGYPSGQRDLTVTQLAQPSGVRIPHPPPSPQPLGVGDFRLVKSVVDFVLIIEGRVLGRGVFGRPAKQRQNGRPDEQKSAHRDNDSGDNAERDTPRVHTSTLSGATDA